MITRLIIKNFQCHDKMTLEIDPLVTTIVGQSDRGKSAIIRAFRWICLNSPSGMDFLKHGESTVSVKIEIDDHTLIRQRSDKENVYILDGNKYSALGAGGIPESVSELLNIDIINFQSQLDPPFWFSLSSGEVSKELNKIVNLTLIDSTLKNIASLVRSTKSTLEVCQDRLTTAKEKVEQYQWVKECNEDLNQLEQRESDIAQIRSKTALLGSLIDQVTLQTNTRQESLEIISDASSMIKYGDILRDHQQTMDRLRSLLTELEQSWQRKKDQEALLTVAENEMKDLTMRGCPLCGQTMIEMSLLSKEVE